MTEQEMYHIQPTKSAADIPNSKHLAVLVQKVNRFDIPGDERSRTNPGHGYPATTEFVHQLEYFPFYTPEAATEYVQYLVSKKHSPVHMDHIRVIQVAGTARVTVTTQVSINIY